MSTTGGDVGAVRRPRSWWSRAVFVVGLVALVVVADYLAGWTIDAVRTDEATETTSTGSSLRLRSADAPALAGSPWAAEHLEAVSTRPSTYWPFTEQRPLPHRTPYLNTLGWERVSLPPATEDADAPDVWLLGGSMAFGVGQRDEHTIASELVRLASADGLSVRVRNYGQPDWVHLQETVLYEQLLAAEPTPALALFLDGPADIEAQGVFDGPVAALLRTQDYASAIDGRRIATGTRPPDQPDLWQELTDQYRAHSLSAKALRWLGLGDDPAGATPAQDEPTDDPGSAFTSAAVGRDAAAVYERARFLSAALSDRAGVDARWYWQPMALPGDAVRASRADLPPSTVDLHEVLEARPEVFIDGADVNETGARLVAEALYADIEPALRAWHERSGD